FLSLCPPAALAPFPWITDLPAVYDLQRRGFGYGDAKKFLASPVPDASPRKVMYYVGRRASVSKAVRDGARMQAHGMTRSPCDPVFGPMRHSAEDRSHAASQPKRLDPFARLAGRNRSRRLVATSAKCRRRPKQALPRPRRALGGGLSGLAQSLTPPRARFPGNHRDRPQAAFLPSTA